jgi:hypothetical protein
MEQQVQLPVGTTPSFKEVELRPLFFGVQPKQGAYAAGIGGGAAIVTWLASSFWWMLPVFPVVGGSAFILFAMLCSKNRHWWEYTFGGHGYKATRWLKG